MTGSAWGPNPAWAGKKRPPQAVARSGDGEDPSCMTVAVPAGVVIGTLIAWLLRRC